MSINIGPADQLADGRGLQVPENLTGHSRPIAVFRDGDAFHAVDDTCTHLHAALSQGTCDNGVVRCWLHGGTFSAVTGESDRYPATGQLTVHEVVEEGGDLWLTVQEDRYREHLGF